MSFRLNVLIAFSGSKCRCVSSIRSTPIWPHGVCA